MCPQRISNLGHWLPVAEAFQNLLITGGSFTARQRQSVCLRIFNYVDSDHHFLIHSPWWRSHILGFRLCMLSAYLDCAEDHCRVVITCRYPAEVGKTLVSVAIFRSIFDVEVPAAPTRVLYRSADRRSINCLPLQS